MSRPRVIKLNGGDISLTNFSTEVADNICLLLKSASESGFKSTVAKVPLIALSTEELPDKSIGLHVDRKTLEAKIVIIGYDLDTNEAHIEKVTKCEGMKEAINTFKIEAANHNFV